MTIAEQMFRVVDYLFDNGLEDKVHIFQINHAEMDMLHYNPESGPKTTNHCGTCTHMRCLGFDAKVYGCNRFCTMPYPISIGYADKKGIKITNQALCDEVAKQYELWPDECKHVHTASNAPHARPSHTSRTARKPSLLVNRSVVHPRMVAARLYFQNRLLEKEAQDELAPE